MDNLPCFVFGTLLLATSKKNNYIKETKNNLKCTDNKHRISPLNGDNFEKLFIGLVGKTGATFHYGKDKISV